MAYLLVIALATVLYLYGRSVFSATRHSLRELMGFLTLVLGGLFIAVLLVLLTLI